MAKKDTELQQVAVWAAVAIVAIVILVLFLLKSPIDSTGSFTYAGGYKQYEPNEACQVNGCTLVSIRMHGDNPTSYRTEMAVCNCGAYGVRYVPLRIHVY